MGNIRIREKKDGKKSYTAQVRIKGHIQGIFYLKNGLKVIIK